MKIKVYVYLSVLLTLLVLSVLTVGVVSAADEDKNEDVAGEDDDEGDTGAKGVAAEEDEEEDDDKERKSRKGRKDDEEDQEEEDDDESDKSSGVEGTKKSAEPIRIMTFPSADEGGLTSVALSCFGLVRLFGVAIFGRGPYLISVHGLRRFISILGICVFLLAYNHDSLTTNVPAGTVPKYLHYLRHVCGRFMWSGLFTALVQFFGSLIVQQMYDPFMAAIMTPQRMKSMAALYEIMTGLRHLMLAFLEYAVPFIWIPVNILMPTACVAPFPETNFTPMAYCIGFVLWLFRELAFQKMFVTSFFVMALAELIFVASWIHLFATSP